MFRKFFDPVELMSFLNDCGNNIWFFRHFDFSRLIFHLVKGVEFLVFGVHENPLLLSEVHMIDGTMLIMFLDRQNSENT